MEAGEIEHYRTRAVEPTQPIAKMFAKGIKVEVDIDATRVASYSLRVSFDSLVTGKTVCGLRLYRRQNGFDHETTLPIRTENVTWFSGKKDPRGRIEAGQLSGVSKCERR